MKNYKNFSLSPLLFLCMFLLACATPGFETHIDVAPDSNISGYKTFSWISDTPLIQQPGNVIISPLNAQRIQTAIENKLTSKGYQFESLTEKPDFTVSYTVGTRDKLNVQSYPRYYRNTNWNWPYYDQGEVYVHEYTEGTLAIDLFDYQSGKPVWHGVPQKKVLQSDRNHPNAAITLAVNAILDRLENN